MSQIRSNPDAIVLSKVDSDHSIYQRSRGYQGFQPNLTGSDGRYIPYSTTKPKIEKWNQVIS